MTAHVFDAVSLLSDAGTEDESVGIFHSVLRDLAPHASITDLTHSIRPGDVRSASVILARCIAYVPAGVVVAAVDAGITATRRCIAVQVGEGRGIILGPDNGVIAPAVAMAGGAEEAAVLDRRDLHLASPGAVWPARDILVGVAAQLCNGVPLAEVGTAIDPGVLLPGVIPLPRELTLDGHPALVADVLSIDRSGVCQLNVDPEQLAGWGGHVSIAVGDSPGRAAALLADPAQASSLRPGALAMLVDAFGMVSLIAGQRSAASELGLGVADQLTLQPGQAPGGQRSETAVFLAPPRPR